MRLQIFCSEKVGKLCAGTVKIRTRDRIQPATAAPKRKLRRVTLVTEEYQIRQGADRIRDPRARRPRRSTS